MAHFLKKIGHRNQCHLLKVEEHILLKKTRHVTCKQCDQIGRYFPLWATFQSLWQQLFYPNLLRS